MGRGMGKGWDVGGMREREGRRKLSSLSRARFLSAFFFAMSSSSPSCRDNSLGSSRL
jgi:hypothetical protein